MRATNHKHYGSDTKRYQKNEPARAAKTAKKHKGFKVISFACAVIIVSAALVIPTATTLAPNVDAYEDSKAASFSVGGLDQFSAAISKNCAVEAKATEALTTAAATEAQKATTAVKAESKSEAKSDKSEAKTEEKAAESKTSEASSKTEEKTTSSKSSSSKSSASSSSSASSLSVSYYDDDDDYDYDSYDDYDYDDDDDYNYGYSGGVILDIDNADPSYSPSRVSLSSYDRAKLERLVMGEGGDLGYLGAALVAQAIRDAMNRSNTNSIDQIISQYQYSGSTSMEPNSDVREAVSFIFDQNGSAVQHRVLIFYTGSSAWHETQTFIAQVGSERFFDMKY